MLVIFSRGYTESKWCLTELLRIKERVEEGKLMAIPIFDQLDVKEDSGYNLLNLAVRDANPERVKKWKEALDSVSCMMGFHLFKNSPAEQLITRIVKDVKRLLNQISVEKIEKSHDKRSEQQKYDFELMDSWRSEALEEVDGESDGVLAEGKSDVIVKEAETAQGEATDLLGGVNSDAIPNTQNMVEKDKVDLVYDEKKQDNERY